MNQSCLSEPFNGSNEAKSVKKTIGMAQMGRVVMHIGEAKSLW